MDDVDIFELLGYDPESQGEFGPRGIFMDVEHVDTAAVVALFLQRRGEDRWDFYPMVFPDGHVALAVVNAYIEEHHRQGTSQP